MLNLHNSIQNVSRHDKRLPFLTYQPMFINTVFGIDDKLIIFRLAVANLMDPDILSLCCCLHSL